MLWRWPIDPAEKHKVQMIVNYSNRPELDLHKAVRADEIRKILGAVQFLICTSPIQKMLIWKHAKLFYLLIYTGVNFGFRT
jgi:hypothetical protein